MSAPQRFPPDAAELNEAVHELHIDLVMFKGESRTDLVHLTFLRTF